MKTTQETLLQMEEAISFVKETFSAQLAKSLSLIRVSSPLAVLSGTGINDDLNGVERPVRFPVKSLQEQEAVVVHSLAKWKRMRLGELGIPQGRGILTDMRALRPDEDFTPLHSIYVDQWDWEAHISPAQRSIEFLRQTVTRIYQALLRTEAAITEQYPDIQPILPEQITFIHSEELLQRYPDLSSKERETEAARQYGAVFIMGIGGVLSNGQRHDGRAPDYDDWSSPNEEGFMGLNGDIVVWHPVLQSAFELSSMGVRVDKEALLRQLAELGCSHRSKLHFHRLLLQDAIPQSIGGGIGQSRVAMFLLRKSHIGEVQVGIWSDDIRQEMLEKGVQLL